jgi:hypothetical protein
VPRIVAQQEFDQEMSAPQPFTLAGVPWQVNATGFAAQTIELHQSGTSICTCATDDVPCIEEWITRNFRDSVMVLLGINPIVTLEKRRLIMIRNLVSSG